MRTIRKMTKNIMGMELDEWTHESCIAHVAQGIDWATVYDIKSEIEGKGHATELLKHVKDYYKKKGIELKGSVALNDRMRALYERVGIPEYV